MPDSLLQEHLEWNGDAVTVPRRAWAMFALLLRAPAPDNPRLRALMAMEGGPEITPLVPEDAASGFSSGEEMLDEGFRRDALRSPFPDAFGAYGVRLEGRVAGYYRLRRLDIVCATPKPGEDPVLRIVTLPLVAVDTAFQGRGLGTVMLADSTRRCFAAGEAIGLDGYILPAMSAATRPFYARYGFRLTPDVIHPHGLWAVPSEARGPLSA